MHQVTYAERLDELVKIAQSIPGTSGHRALRSIIMDLNGHGPIGELMHTLDREKFDKVIALLVEFRNRRPGNFDTLHDAARSKLL